MKKAKSLFNFAKFEILQVKEARHVQYVTPTIYVLKCCVIIVWTKQKVNEMKERHLVVGMNVSSRERERELLDSVAIE